MRWPDGIADPRDGNLQKLREMGKDREAWRGCSLWGRRQSDTPERLTLCFALFCSFFWLPVQWLEGS